MIRGRVLVIDGEQTGEELASVLRSKGYVVDVCKEARGGFSRACELLPDCILCNPELPDIDGAWVARRVRTESGPLSRVPFLFVGAVIDKDVRTQALGVGVDVFLARPPASDEEIAAQVDALIAMARRLGHTSEERAPSSTSFSAAIRGDLSAFPLASMLMMFEMEQRSGTIQVVAESGKRAVLAITHGLFASTEIDRQAKPPLDVLREVLSWRSGRFSFQPRESSSLPEPKGSVSAIVLEAMRLEDESKPGAKPRDYDSELPPASSAAIAAAQQAQIRESLTAINIARGVESSVPPIELDSTDLIEAESLPKILAPRPPPPIHPGSGRVPSPPDVPRVSSRPRSKKTAG